MRKMTLAVVVLMVFAVAASANGVCVVGNNVLALNFSCSVGGLLFSNFGAQGNAGYLGLPASIGITSVVTGGEIELGFAPAPAMDWAVGGLPDDMYFWFRVRGTHLGVDLHNLGTGETSIGERVCDAAGVTAGGSCLGTQILMLPAAASNVEVEALYATPQSDVWIWKDVGITGETGHISSFEQSFMIPEPVTLGLIGVGLLALGLLRRRLKK